MDKRVKWVDYAKAISIFFVVLLHAGIPDPGKGLVRVFLIPLFFFLSGIFTNRKHYFYFLSPCRDFFTKLARAANIGAFSNPTMA